MCKVRIARMNAGPRGVEDVGQVEEAGGTEPLPPVLDPVQDTPTLLLPRQTPADGSLLGAALNELDTAVADAVERAEVQAEPSLELHDPLAIGGDAVEPSEQVVDLEPVVLRARRDARRSHLARDRARKRAYVDERLPAEEEALIARRSVEARGSRHRTPLDYRQIERLQP